MSKNEIDETLAPSTLAEVPEPLASAMRRRGFETLTKVQSAVLAAESEGRDLRVSSQTGSGKTVAIGLALASHLEEEAGAKKRRGPSVLVIVPTRELAMQVKSELSWLFEGLRGFAVEVVMGGASIGLERRALSRRPTAVVATPGRALDHIRNGVLVCEDVAHVILDEADHMFDMGFREELEGILDQLPEKRRSHLVSATLPQAVRRLADKFQTDPLHIEGTQLGAANQDIEHIAHLVEQRDCYGALVNLLLLNEGGRCLVFVERRIDVTDLAAKLSGDGFPVQSLSGELPQAQRTRTINAFRDGSVKTLIATDVAARGIDVPNIELVIHMEPPTDTDTYVHRSGRTGRAGCQGKSVLIVSPRVRGKVTRLLRYARLDVKWTAAPSASRVRKHLRKQFRQGLNARIVSEEGPTQKQIDYAKKLLDGREPAEIVAALLDLAEPKPTREPMEISEPREYNDRADRRGSERQAAPGSVRFKINWGEETGAATNRVLGHVCRRGQIRGHLVRGIEIGPNESSFEIDATSAVRFEKLVQKRDPRDPDLRIVRVGGAAPRRNGPPRGPGGARHDGPPRGPAGHRGNGPPRGPAGPSRGSAGPRGAGGPSGPRAEMPFGKADKKKTFGKFDKNKKKKFGPKRKK